MRQIISMISRCAGESSGNLRRFFMSNSSKWLQDVANYGDIL